MQKVSREDIGKYCSVLINELEQGIYKMLDVKEKPAPDEIFSEFAILGRYVLTSEIFSVLENTPPGYGGEIQLTDGLCTLCKQSSMVAVDFKARRYDTGNMAGYLETLIDFALIDPEVGPWLKEYLKRKVETEF